MQSAIAPEWITFSGLRMQFGISRSTGNRLIAAGLIDARKVGRRVLINTHSVRQHLNRLPRPTIKPDDKSDRLAAKSLATT
jgi:excisionase family DNA binding protein